jgi:hypothetical protein
MEDSSSIEDQKVTAVIATSVALKILENFPVGNIVNFHSDQ